MMAPEFFSNPVSGYSMEVDFYSLGILLYEFSFRLDCLFIVRKPPFPFNEVPSFDYSILDDIESDPLRNLLKSLISPPESRINTFPALKSCEYFSEIDWARLESAINDDTQLEDYSYEFGLTKYYDDIRTFSFKAVEYSIIRPELTEEEKDANEIFNELF